MRRNLYGFTLAAILVTPSVDASAMAHTVPDPSPVSMTKPALAKEINALFAQDQAILGEQGAAKNDKAFAMTYGYYAHRVTDSRHLLNFYDPYVYELWDQDTKAPDLVHRAAKWRRTVDARIQAIVAEGGWPRRRDVGDAAAASFFFLFGHADDINDWRLTQIPAIEQVFREDHLNPQLYAHMRDRLLCVSEKPQIFGSIMGPGNMPGTARFYWPLVNDDITAADKRRAAIGLPSIETNLQKFRDGAEIAAYMAPLTKEEEKNWTLADAFSNNHP